MAKTLPREAKRRAVKESIPLVKAVAKATSELNGKIVPAKKAHKKRANS